MLRRKGWTLFVLLVILATLFLTPAANAQEPEVIKIVAMGHAGNEQELTRGRAIEIAGEMLNYALELVGAGVRVEVETIFEPGAEWADLNKKFLMAMEAGEGPDIMCSGHEQIAAYAEAGYIIPLDDYIADHPATYEVDLIQSLWKSCEYKGQRWAVPQDTEARPLYFSKLLLRELGWSEEDIEALPGKIESGEFAIPDMLEVAREAIDKGVVEEGYGFWHRPSQGPDFYEFYYAFGGQMQDPDTGKLVVDEAAMRKHLEFHATLTTDKLMRTDVLGMAWPEFKAAIAPADKVLFAADGTWRWADWAKNFVADLGGDEYLKENMGFGLIPAAEKGGTPVTLSHPLVYAVTSQSEHPELAFLLITLATSPAINTIHATETNHLAILNTEVAYPVYAGYWFLTDVAYMLNYTTFLPNHAEFGTYDGIIFRALSAVEAGDVTVDEALEIIKEELDFELGDEVIFK